MSKIKKIGLAGVVLAIVFVLVFICFNRKEKKIDRKQDLPVSTETISEYSFANSYHLYTMDCQYNLDGGQVKALNISNTDSPYDMMFLCVNDMWYYCYEKQEEITGKLWRIPIQSGELRQEKKEAVIDTEQNGSFTVAGNNYVEVTKGNRIRVYDMVRKKYSDYKVPKEISYTKKTEWENRTWDVLAQGNDWIVWKGENGFFAQDIAKEKITILGEDASGLAIASAGQRKMYFAPDKREKGVLCYQYDLIENRKEKIVDEDVRGCITNYLKKKDIRDIVLENFLNNGSEVFFEVKVVTNREKFNVVLKKESNKFVVDTQLSDILQTKKNIELIDCFQSRGTDILL